MALDSKAQFAFELDQRGAELEASQALVATLQADVREHQKRLVVLELHSEMMQSEGSAEKSRAGEEVEAKIQRLSAELEDSGAVRLRERKRRMSQDLKVALEQQEVEGGVSVKLLAEVARLSAELEASQAVVQKHAGQVNLVKMKAAVLGAVLEEEDRKLTAKAQDKASPLVSRRRSWTSTNCVDIADLRSRMVSISNEDSRETSPAPRMTISPVNVNEVKQQHDELRSGPLFKSGTAAGAPPGAKDWHSSVGFPLSEPAAAGDWEQSIRGRSGYNPYQARLFEIYSQHNPEKLANIENLVSALHA